MLKLTRTFLTPKAGIFSSAVSGAPAAAAVATRSMSLTRPEPAMAGKLTDTGTRRIFSEEHDMFRDAARRFFQEEVVPHHKKWEEEGQVSRELWLKAGETGLLATMMPEEYGGPGGDVLTAAIVWEEQAYTGCTGPGFALHSEIVAPYILNYGTEEQKQKFIPKLVSGEHIGAIAMSEPAAGSDLQGVKTVAVDKGDHFVLNGSKTFITNGAMADTVIVVCKTDPEKGAHGTSLLLVEEGMEGFQRGRKLKKMGLHAQDTSELFFEDVKVPKENLLGEQNKGFKYLMQELPQERLLIADIGLSAAEACFEETREYIHDRKAFGAPLSKFPTIRHKMAELLTKLSVGRAFCDQCIELHNEDKLTSSMASMAKYWLTDLQNEVADECVQIFGGYGYMQEYSVSRHYIDARVQKIYGGTNEIMKELIARQI